MRDMQGVLLDVLVALVILWGGGAILTQLSGVGEDENAPFWVAVVPLAAAIGYLGWRTMVRNRRRREQDARQAEESGGPVEGEVREVRLDEGLSVAMSDYEWRSGLGSQIRNLGRDAFERFTVRILNALAVTDVRVVGTAFDGAVECAGVHDDEERASVFAVCRRSYGAQGASQVRDLREQLEGKAEEGLLITNGDFTRSAVDEADGEGAPVDLVDGDELLDLMHTNRMGLRFDAEGQVTGVDESWFNDLGRDERTAEGD